MAKKKKAKKKVATKMGQRGGEEADGNIEEEVRKLLSDKSPNTVLVRNGHLTLDGTESLTR